MRAAEPGQSLLEVSRRSALAIDGLRGQGVGKGKRAGMEKRPATRGTRLTAVHPIANDGMADRAQMETDLMLAAGIQFDLDQSGSVQPLLDPVVGDRVAGRLIVVSGDVALAAVVRIGDGEIDGA